MSRLVVLDASAVLAVLHKEQGGVRVAECMVDGGAISSVNLAEVLSKQTELGIPASMTASYLELMGIAVHPFDTEAAMRVAALRSSTRSAGLSLADRACIALGEQLEAPVMTADRIWGQLQLSVEIVVIR